jgi:ADP-ribose pyrophosphatase YjhB (NUDIX family)
MIDETWYVRPEGVRERTSAGGVVVRVDGSQVYVALAHEGGFPTYVLPKGRLEAGETPEQAARREIAEEAGFSTLSLLAGLGVRERLSFSRKQWIRTHYFLFLTPEAEGVPADSAKHSQQAEWFSLDSLPPMLWPEQRELIETYRERIASLALEAAHRGGRG